MAKEMKQMTTAEARELQRQRAAAATTAAEEKTQVEKPQEGQETIQPTGQRKRRELAPNTGIFFPSADGITIDGSIKLSDGEEIRIQLVKRSWTNRRVTPPRRQDMYTAILY